VSAIIIDGRAVAKAIRDEIAVAAASMAAEGLATPHLGVVLCGDDPASATRAGPPSAPAFASP
jgi:methylenetetrahydrofolate dehydrogenase (NADP+)/methenyltetrahydrofolate cyclohydrolase